MKIGDSIIYVDDVGVEHDALTTAIHGQPEDRPSVNLLYVSGNTNETDQYGRQIKRESSVVYQALQGAHANYWRFVSQ